MFSKVEIDLTQLLNLQSHNAADPQQPLWSVICMWFNQFFIQIARVTRPIYRQLSTTKALASAPRPIPPTGLCFGKFNYINNRCKTIFSIILFQNSFSTKNVITLHQLSYIIGYLLYVLLQVMLEFVSIDLLWNFYTIFNLSIYRFNIYFFV